MNAEGILMLAAIGIMVIIVLAVRLIFLDRKYWNLYAENRMLRRTIESQSRLDELSFAAQQAMINEALRVNRMNSQN